MKPVYYFLHDNSTQWFSYIVEIDGDKVCEMIQVPNDISGDFLTNILQREIHFSNKTIRGEPFAGWSISKMEFDKLREIVLLYPSYKKYLKMCHEG